jgi:hypothetical protein
VRVEVLNESCVRRDVYVSVPREESLDELGVVAVVPSQLLQLGVNGGDSSCRSRIRGSRMVSCTSRNRRSHGRTGCSRHRATRRTDRRTGGRATRRTNRSRRQSAVADELESLATESFAGDGRGLEDELEGVDLEDLRTIKDSSGERFALPDGVGGTLPLERGPATERVRETAQPTRTRVGGAVESTAERSEWPARRVRVRDAHRARRELVRKCVRECGPECVPERVLGCVSERVLERVPERVLECGPERVLGCVPDREPRVPRVPDLPMSTRRVRYRARPHATSPGRQWAMYMATRVARHPAMHMARRVARHLAMHMARHIATRVARGRLPTRAAPGADVASDRDTTAFAPDRSCSRRADGGILRGQWAHQDEW